MGCLNLKKKVIMNEGNWQKAIFANGCFWCAEAVYQRLQGIKNVESGFTGGKIKNPAYREVVRGYTNHAEGIQLDYNADLISYETLVNVFFTTHDPTTLNRQQYDVGKQYRSAIFYLNEEQKQIAKKVIDKLNKTVFDGKIVTELTEASEFYVAEEMHQNFYNQNNGSVGYCQVIIDPKLKKLRESFSDLLQEPAS